MSVFTCEQCIYSTIVKSNYNKHLKTNKHKVKLFDYTLNHLTCLCGVSFKSKASLSRHKQECQKKTIIDKDEIILTLLKQHAELLELNKNHITTNNVNNSFNNNNNKTFNLQFFLNETCKDAMNIMDFVESIQLQLSDLEKVGELGYTQGISNIITSNLNALDVTQRPVHCTDKKRETMYVKDEGKWEKEDEQKSTIRKTIRKVASKNIKLLPQYRETNPEYKNPRSKLSDKYDTIVLEAMGGTGDSDDVKEDKIIHNISNCTTIEKHIKNELIEF